MATALIVDKIKEAAGLFLKGFSKSNLDIQFLKSEAIVTDIGTAI